MPQVSSDLVPLLREHRMQQLLQLMTRDGFIPNLLTDSLHIAPPSLFNNNTCEQSVQNRCQVIVPYKPHHITHWRGLPNNPLPSTITELYNVSDQTPSSQTQVSTSGFNTVATTLTHSLTQSSSLQCLDKEELLLQESDEELDMPTIWEDREELEPQKKRMRLCQEDIDTLNQEDGCVPLVDYESGCVPLVDHESGCVPPVDRDDDCVPLADNEDNCVPLVDREDDCVPLVDREDDCVPLVDRDDDCVPQVDRDDDCVPPVDRDDDCVPPVDRGDDCVPPVDREDDCVPLVDRDDDCVPLVDGEDDCVPLLDRDDDCVPQVNHDNCLTKQADNNVLSTELADDGISTTDQAVPSECAREHALIPNLVPCRQQEQQGGIGRRRGGGGEGNGGCRDQHITSYHQQTNQTIIVIPSPEQQVVPYDREDEDVDDSLVIPTLYEHIKNPSKDGDITTLDDDEHSSRDEFRDKTGCHSPSKHSYYTHYPPLHHGHPSIHHNGYLTRGDGFPSTTLLNLSRPKLRLGLSKCQKPKPLHSTITREE